MLSKFSVSWFNNGSIASPGGTGPSSLFLYRSDFPKSRRHRLRFKLVGQSSGDNKWKLKEIDTKAVQEQLSSWFSKTQNFIAEVASPLVKSGSSGKITSRKANDTLELEEVFLVEPTIQRNTRKGVLSLAALVSIEQFSRMNGSTGYKMQKIFKALVAEPVYSDARNLVEYCCFRFLSRDSSAFHPCLKGKLVGEDAFIRIAPAVPGVADHSTVHNLFKALAGDERGISVEVWLTYIDELLKVHDGRMAYQTREYSPVWNERVLCIGSSKKQPVLKWENNMAWPGKVTLTDKALYFEVVDLLGKRSSTRLDLTRNGFQVQKTKVGPLGAFDSAVSVGSSSGSERLVLEFVDLGGELRRDAWHAFISEVVSLHKFISEFGPEDGDPLLSQVYGARKGKERAINDASNSIARLQALQFMRKLVDDPLKLGQFSYLRSAPFGEIVCQSLALNYWGGPLVKTYTDDDDYEPTPGPVAPTDGVSKLSSHLLDIDGSIYLRQWMMRSPSWSSSASINFWKRSSKGQGSILSKDLVVADRNLVERAASTCREKFKVAEKTQETIDAAMLKGIPSNIDLFKELILPLSMAAKNFQKLRRWEEPHLTVSFLAFAYSIIFRNLLSYVFPMMLIVLAAGMLTLKGLKRQGRLGRSFGKIVIRDQPPSNTVEKIIAVKDAMRDVEKYLQNLNVVLLKIRNIFLSGQPQVTMEVALVLLSSATVLLIVPFKYILAFFLFDTFTRELEFRKEMVRKFTTLLKERWETVPAAPVVVVPFESKESRSANEGKKPDE
ncbi:unnamed protein product [Linum tenue]|uniref:Uncharacterized protein n=1 Tax=Linum tenue TaxID=586396 RepID=A0AAV0LYY9_9ROSI|nr:unnamed protein product [Linum tenue]